MTMMMTTAMTMTTLARLATFSALLLCGVFVVDAAARTVVRQNESAQDGALASGRSSQEVARLLSSKNPLQRREAAEELARAASVEHLRLVEGYRVQEGEARVRLALDWALYRMGKRQALFPVVRDLDSSRTDQAFQYLSALDGPEPLYVFLNRVNGKTQIRLLELLARLGDADTLEQIKPFEASLDPVVSDAAKFAEREISIRLEESPRDEPKRPRQTGKRDEDEP